MNEARHSLNCMEIRGGSARVEHALATPGLEGWITSLPFEGAERGGDVHYVSLCGGGVVTRIVVADVSGHGEAAAATAKELRSLVRKFINTKGQRRLVASLNRKFGELAKLDWFATAVVATYLADRDRLSICNAGHPRPLYYQSQAREWRPLSQASLSEAAAENLPLGIDDDSRYDLFHIKLSPGDYVVIYTDALVEAHPEGGAPLGEEGLLALARETPLLDPERFGAALLESVRGFRGGAALDDDVTLLVLKHTGSASPRLSIKQKLDVYAKVFGLKAV